MKSGNGALLGVCNRSNHWQLEQLEPRLLLSTAPTVLSINREIPAGAVTEASSVTYAVAFSEPVTGVTSADFQLALTGGTTASSTVVVSPDSGYNSAYDVTVNGISGDGTLGLNLLDNGSIVDTFGSHLANNGTFQRQQTFAVGEFSNSIAVTDVNGDGKPDLVVANISSNNISVLLGNGDGTFQTQKTFATGTGSNPCSIAVADVNGDGNPDMVVANNESNNVGVLLGNGDGTFQTQKTFATSTYPESVAVTDVNGDDKPDLVVANGGSNNVGVLLGNGNGTFLTQKTFAVGTWPMSVAVADVNSDGKPDLVAANLKSNNVSVLLGKGDGTFQAQKTFAAGPRAFSIAVADINGDGKPDLVVANESSNTISALLGNGDGTFQAQKTFATGSAPDSVAVTDVNGDGKPDLVVVNAGSTSYNVSVLLGNGDGTFQTQRTFAAGSQPSSVAVADFNGDGTPDLAVANFFGGTVSVLLNNNQNFTGQIYTVDQPTQLTFTNPPSSTTVGTVIRPAVTVAVQDASGKTVILDTSNVTLTLNSGTFASGGNTVTATAVNGIATFNNMIINTAGNYTLTASDGALTGATSGSFAICDEKLTFTQQPTSTGDGAVITPAVTVTVQDPFGNTVTTDSSSVTITLNHGTFASGGNTATAVAASGIATFNNLIINAAGYYTLIASDSAMLGAMSGTFTIGLPGDVNLDGVLNAADIDAIYAHFGQPSTSQWKVYPDNLPVGQEDVTYELNNYFHTTYGDANLDTYTDFSDFQVLLDHWMNSGTYPQWENGDFTGNGMVDFADFQKILDNWTPYGFGATQQSVVTSTPSAAESAAVAGQAADSAVAAPAVPLAVAGPVASNQSATASVPTDAHMNLLTRGAMFPSAETCFRQTAPEAWHPATRQLRHSAGSVQDADSDSVDLLTQLHSRPVVA